MIAVLIITHGLFGKNILDSAVEILGSQDNVATLGLTAHDSRDSLLDKLKETMKSLNLSEGIIFLTDMAGGTPCNVVLPLIKEIKCEVCTGLNLYMLLSALNGRKAGLSLEELTKKVVQDGKKNIMSLREQFISKIS